MNLTIIIVSYNVCHYLEQCLRSVLQASQSINANIFVVDNGSEDGSVQMVKTKFPQVRLIANKDNIGFSKANNQAIRQSASEYILILNPDTVLEEDALTKSLNFMNAHPEAGGLGIKMIDGYGRFLPESKRGLPTPWASFCKMSRLSQLFPRSEFFNRYHLGYLDENKTNSIEVLAGAFMLLRKKVLDSIGLMDEDFFMYGEDIDLSYRITKAGFVNYYFPEARMIHYKGESTRKSSMNYIRLFYGAMLIFAKKHFAGKNQRLLSMVILPGVYIRAAIAMLCRLFNMLAKSAFVGSLLKTYNRLMSSVIEKKIKIKDVKLKHITLVIANQNEVKKINRLVKQNKNERITTILITPSFGQSKDTKTLKSLDHELLDRLITEIKGQIDRSHASEIIFSTSDFTYSQIITLMSRLNRHSIAFRIAHSENDLIIGSNYVHTAQSASPKI